MSSALRQIEDRDATGADEAENRVAHRQRVLKSARASFNDQFSAIPCVMRNVSETGARLQFEDMAIVPRVFTLFVDLDGYKVQCERVWQDGKSCGVRFVGEKIPTKVFRTQVLKSSETALGQQVMRELELRQREQDFVAQRPTDPDRDSRPARRQVVFGRRR